MSTNDANERADQLYLPFQRDDLSLEELDGEAVLYDPRSGAVHRFNATTLLVWDRCDGSHAELEIVRELADIHSIDAEDGLKIVECALAQLRGKGLLKGEPDCSGKVPEADSECIAVPVYLGVPEPELATENRTSVGEGDVLGQGLSRRQVLTGGVTGAMLAAPVISTFFASGAYASGPSASGAYGPGGCKESQYSCFVDVDCCQAPSERKCEFGMCCVKLNQDCNNDADCCSNAGSGCDGGQCRP